MAHSLHALKNSESSVNHLDERIFEKCSSHVFFFFLKLNGQRGFSFLSDYDTKFEKGDESKKDIKRIKLQMNEL